MFDEALQDRQLVDRMLRGDEKAFEEFFGTYFPGLYRFVLVRLHQDTTGAEEIVQRVLCKAISKLSTYRGEAALFTWLCTFCRHEISAYLKDEKRIFSQASPIRETPEVIAALESLLKTEHQGPDQIVLKKEIAQLVQVALEALPSRYAEALEWKYLDDLSVSEIATRMNLGLKATESLLTRARQAFRDAFLAVSSGLAWQPRFQRGG